MLNKVQDNFYQFHFLKLTYLNFLSLNINDYRTNESKTIPFIRIGFGLQITFHNCQFFFSCSCCQILIMVNVHVTGRNIIFSVIRRCSTSTHKFVPTARGVSRAQIEEFCEFVDRGRNILVLTGAGISTESGIPDYRSQGVGLYATSKSRPVIYQDFVKSDRIRQRYWARNFIGWPRFSSVQPNISHSFLKKLEDFGKVCWLVTQNVDALHFKAGSSKVTELHGSTYRVACLRCDYKTTRHDLQIVIENLNPSWRAFSNVLAPDGDIQLSQEEIEGFQVSNFQIN